MKILYLSCHEVLEYDELSLLAELGVEAFPASRYLTAAVSGAVLRPAPPPARSHDDDALAFRSLAVPGHDTRECLTREFVERFDAAIVMHEPWWIVRNWEAMRSRPVVWRTIGQSWPGCELTMHPYRADGLHIVRYSPAERTLPHYAGEDAVIRFYKDPAQWQGWVGERRVAVCFSQFMPERVVECNYDTLETIARRVPCELYGPHNERAKRLWRGRLTYDELRATLRASRACFHTGTFPASYTLGFIEAWMTGIPVVAVGAGLFSRANPALRGLYELPELIEHEANGFLSDDIDELTSCLQCLLARPEYARQVSAAGRAAAIRYFDKAIVREQWRQFLGRLARA